jgi:WD40 repeat protein
LQSLEANIGSALGLVVSPDGSKIIAGFDDGTVKIWSSDGKEIRSFKGHSNSVVEIAFRRDGKVFATASRDKTIKIWSLDGRLVTTLNGHSNPVWAVSFSPDGKTIASSSEDKTVILWNSDRVQNLDPLAFACNWVRDYLKHNSDVSESDTPDGTLRERHLRDRIN